MAASLSALAIETWCLYAIGVCLVLLRIILRLTTLGSFSKLQFDDWLMILILVPFTVTMVSVDLASRYWDSIESAEQLWRLGARFASEESQIVMTWLVKACVLILYRRIFMSTANRKQRRLLAWISGYCLFSFILIQVLLPLWCTPIPSRWTFVQGQLHCTSTQPYNITTLALTTTTTLLVFIYPIPSIPTPRKALLATLLALGTLVLITGILSRYYLLTHPTSQIYLPWTTAEASLTLYFANLPFLSRLLASTTQSRIMRSNLSLTSWPRSRLNSTATEMTSSPTLSRKSRREQLISTTTVGTQTQTAVMSPLEIDDFWSSSDGSRPPSSPPTPPIQRLRLTDAPPELGDYTFGRRGSEVRGLGARSPGWPLP